MAMKIAKGFLDILFYFDYLGEGTKKVQFFTLNLSTLVTLGSLFSSYKPSSVVDYENRSSIQFKNIVFFVRDFSQA